MVFFDLPNPKWHGCVCHRKQLATRTVFHDGLFARRLRERKSAVWARGPWLALIAFRVAL